MIEYIWQLRNQVHIYIYRQHSDYLAYSKKHIQIIKYILYRILKQYMSDNLQSNYLKITSEQYTGLTTNIKDDFEPDYLLLSYPSS